MCMGANVAVLAGRPYVEETSEGTRQPIAEALARRRARRDPDSPLVFHRDGIPIRRCCTAWRTACQATGVPTRFLHDCRRIAARNLIRASVPERVAMLLTGHKSRAIFDRYNIIHEQELLEAGDQLVKYLAQQAQATPRGLNPGFSEKIGNSRRTPQPTPTVVRLASVWCPCIGTGPARPATGSGLSATSIARPAGPAIDATDAPKAPTDGSAATRTKPRWIGWRIASPLGPR